MSDPWFKFYPPNWRGDPALRMCSLAARGLWMEMLCLMHEASPRGFLLVNERPVTERQLASLSGAAAREVSVLIGELEEAGVFSRDDNGQIYSRRMRRETEKAMRDKQNGTRGGNPTLKRGVNPPDNPQPNPYRKPEARSQNLEEESPAQHLDPPGQGGAALSDLEAQLRHAGDVELDPLPAWRNTAPIAALIAEGFDLEREILPVIRARRGAGRSWTWFVGPIRDARKAAGGLPATTPSPAASGVYVRQDSDEGRAWERHEASQGRKIRWLPSNRDQTGKSMPSAFPPS